MAHASDRLTRTRLDYTVGRWRWRPLVEMAVYVAVLLAINLQLYPFDPAYLSTRPHPYLVGVALIAALYGTREGVAAALLAMLALVGQLTAQPGASVASVVADRAVQAQLLWFGGTGYVLGVIRRLGVEQLIDAFAQLADARRQLALVEEQHAVLRAAKDELEQRIIGQTASVHSLYESVKALESLDLPALHTGLLRVVATFTGAQRCSLWLTGDGNDGRLQLAETYGWDAPAVGQMLGAHQGLLGMAVKERRVVTVSEMARATSASTTEPASVLCAPLLVGGRVYGVLNIEQIPFQRLTLSTVRMLGMLADLASPAVDNALEHREAAAERPTDPETGLLRYPHLVKRLTEECSRAQRYKLPLCAMLVDWDGWSELMAQAPERRAAGVREICQALRAHLRAVDLVAHDEQPNRFLIILPLTDLSGVLVVAQRVHQALEAASVPRDARRWIASVAALREHEEAAALQQRLRTALEQAKARENSRPIVMAE